MKRQKTIILKFRFGIFGVAAKLSLLDKQMEIRWHSTQIAQSHHIRFVRILKNADPNEQKTTQQKARIHGNNATKVIINKNSHPTKNETQKWWFQTTKNRWTNVSIDAHYISLLCFMKLLGRLLLQSIFIFFFALLCACIWIILRIQNNSKHIYVVPGIICFE